MSDMKQMVDRQDWQELRRSFLGTWNTHATQNVTKLRSWLGNLKTCPEEKLRIVMNYLTGTGFRTGKIKHPAIQKLRDDISQELKRRKIEQKKNSMKG